MYQFQPNFNYYFLFYIEFTIENHLIFKGQKGQKKAGIWTLGAFAGMFKTLLCQFNTWKVGKYAQIAPQSLQ